MQTIATHTGAADRELVSAHEYQRKAGKRAACLLAVVGFVVAIVLIAVSLPGCVGPPSNTLTRPRAGSELMPGSALHTAFPASRLHTWPRRPVSTCYHRPPFSHALARVYTAAQGRDLHLCHCVTECERRQAREMCVVGRRRDVMQAEEEPEREQAGRARSL